VTVQEEMQAGSVNAFGVKMDSWKQGNSTWEMVFAVTP